MTTKQTDYADVPPPINPYIRLLRLDRPVGTLLLLFPTLIALLVVNGGLPPLKDLAVFVLGVFLTRAAGCVANDIADRNLDKSVARTKARPVASGEISVLNALLVFAGLAAAGFLLLLGFFPTHTWVWAFLSLGLMLVYPLTKRFFKVPQVVLGFAFSMPVPFVYSYFGVNPFTALTAWLLFVGNFAWILAYDTNYAISDMSDDRNAGVYSSALTFGRHVKLFILGFNLVYLLTFVILGWYLDFGALFYTGLVVMAVVLISHYFSVKEEEPQTGFQAFKQNITVGWIAVAAVVLGFISHHQVQAQYWKAQYEQASEQARLATAKLEGKIDVLVEGSKHAQEAGHTQAPAEPTPEQKTVGTPAAQPAEEKKEQPAEQPAQEPVKQPAQPAQEPSPAEQPAQPAEQPAEKPTENKKEQPAEQPAQPAQPAEQPAEQPAPAQPAEDKKEQPAQEPAPAQPADKPAEQPAEQPVQPAEQPAPAQPAEDKKEQPADKPAEQPAEKPADKPAEAKPADKPAE